MADSIKDSGGGKYKKGKRTAGGLNGAALSSIILDSLSSFNLGDFGKVSVGSDGITRYTSVNFEEARKDAHRRIADAINRYIKSECYMKGHYNGALSAGGPDKNGVYEFEVAACNLQPEDFMNLSTDSNVNSALKSYEESLSRALEQAIIFKFVDATGYIFGERLKLREGSVNISLPRNIEHANKSREEMFQDLADAIVFALHKSRTWLLTMNVTSYGPGSGTWIFSEIV